MVWEGRKKGIFEDWATCKTQIDFYPNAKYKSFSSLNEAEEAFKKKPIFQTHIKPIVKVQKSLNLHTHYIKDSLAVDAACSGNPGILEYQGVYTKTKQRLFYGGPFPQGTNNIGEFLAIVHGLIFLANNNKLDTPIYSDSKTAISWVKKKKANTTLPKNKTNQLLFEKVEKAEDWLLSHTYLNPILKWDTERWGEIPADFGRK